MTKDYLGLHSHSGIEREFGMKTNKVLVDFKFAPMFDLSEIGEIYTRQGMKYVEVDTMAFLRHNGVFRNFSE